MTFALLWAGGLLSWGGIGWVYVPTTDLQQNFHGEMTLFSLSCQCGNVVTNDVFLDIVMFSVSNDLILLRERWPLTGLVGGELLVF